MTQSWCYYTIFVTQYGLLHAAKRRYHERITEVRQNYDVVLVAEHAYQLSTPPRAHMQGRRIRHIRLHRHHHHSQ